MRLDHQERMAQQAEHRQQIKAIRDAREAKVKEQASRPGVMAAAVGKVGAWLRRIAGRE